MVLVYTARDSVDARLVRGLLEAKGLAAVVQGETLSHFYGGLTTDTAPCVWIVEKGDVQGAKALTEEHQIPVSPARCRKCSYDLPGATATAPRCPECGEAFRLADPWPCPRCGEVIEGSFTECWKCAGDQDHRP